MFLCYSFCQESSIYVNVLCVLQGIEKKKIHHLFKSVVTTSLKLYLKEEKLAIRGSQVNKQTKENPQHFGHIEMLEVVFRSWLIAFEEYV